MDLIHGAKQEIAILHIDNRTHPLPSGQFQERAPRMEETELKASGAKGTGKPNANLSLTALHARNFLDCMRSRAKPNADLETVGRPSSLLCHMGNIAWRVGRTVKFDYESYNFIGDDEANALRTRAEYRKPYVLPKVEEV